MWSSKDDMVMSDLDVEPLHRALCLKEHGFRTLLTGSSVENLRVLHKVQIEMDPYVTAGPEDEFEPD